MNCCGADWAAEYAYRARQMMNTYRQDGAARVYWLTLPAPRDPARQRISRAVNAAIAVAAAALPRPGARPRPDRVCSRPGGRYRDAMDVGGRQRARPRRPTASTSTTRAPTVALGPVLAALRADFGAAARVPAR